MVWGMLAMDRAQKEEDNMKKKTLTLLPLNLQFFAEDSGSDGASDSSKDGVGAGAADNGGNSDEDGHGEDGAGEKKTFDDILADASYQAEFDRRVQKAINKAVSKREQEWQNSLDDKLTEAEKLAKMTKEQKAEYMTQKKEKELSEREAELNRKELKAEAKVTLAEKKLPVGLSELLDYTSADNCNKSIDALEKAFNEAVEAAVQDKIKGSTTLKKAGNKNISLEEQIANAMKAHY